MHRPTGECQPTFELTHCTNDSTWLIRVFRCCPSDLLVWWLRMLLYIFLCSQLHTFQPIELHLFGGTSPYVNRTSHRNTNCCQIQKCLFTQIITNSVAPVDSSQFLRMQQFTVGSFTAPSWRLVTATVEAIDQCWTNGKFLWICRRTQHYEVVFSHPPTICCWGRRPSGRFHSRRDRNLPYDFPWLFLFWVRVCNLQLGTFKIINIFTEFLTGIIRIHTFGVRYTLTRLLNEMLADEIELNLASMSSCLVPLGEDPNYQD